MSLPSGYKRLEYIQSSGTQYVNTGVLVSKNLEIKLKFMLTSTTNNGIVGYIQSASSGTNRFAVFQYGGAWYFDFGNESTGRISGGSFSPNTLYDITAGNRYIKNNATGYNIISGSVINNLTNSNSISILCETNCGIGKIYSCQIYDNGTIIRDFIPCKKPDGTIGLWDDVNSVFYGNAGTGTFTAGPVIAIAADESEITKLEYIQSSGTQYIDTRITINATTYKRYRFLFDIGYPSIGGSYWLVNGISSSNVIYYFGLSNTGSIVYGNGTADVYGSATASTGRYLVDFNPSDGSYKFGSLQNLTGLTFNAPSGSQNFYLFAYNKGNGQDMHTERLYSAKIYDNGTLVRDFIPTKLSDGTVGLYDKLNGLLYINAGTGTFTAGPVVASPSIFVNIDGIWKPINHIYVNINNIWQKST